MKTAVLISGQIRGFRHITKNLYSNFLNYFGDVDVFVYLSDDNTYKVEEFITPTDITYTKDIIHNETGMNDFQGHHLSTPQKFMQQWYSLQMCKELMLKQNKKYDFVVRTRPDNDFVETITPKILDNQKINICSWGSYSGYNDRFAIGPYDEMVTYCDFYNECKIYPGNSEMKLKAYLTNKNIEVNLIDKIHYRINENGTRREHP
jgi:hypothetical protein